MSFMKVAVSLEATYGRWFWKRASSSAKYQRESFGYDSTWSTGTLSARLNATSSAFSSALSLYSSKTPKFV